MQDSPAEQLRQELANIVEYLEFHTAESVDSDDWNHLLPCHQEVISRAKTLMGKLAMQILSADAR